MSIATAGALCILGRVNFLNLQSTVYAASERGSIAEFCTLTMLVSAARQIDRWDMFEAENPTYLDRLSERKRPAGHIWMLMITMLYDINGILVVGYWLIPGHLTSWGVG